MAPSYTFADADTILQFVLKDLGIGCLPEDYARSAIESGSVIECQFSPTLPERDLYLLGTDAAHESKPAAAMRGILLP